MIIGIAGGSGSGKSTLCQALIDELGAEQVVHLMQDDYYLSQEHKKPGERLNQNYDHPDAIEFSLLAEHIQLLNQGQSVATPQYDFSTHNRLKPTSPRQPKPIILVEGILILTQANIRELLDLAIFVEASEDVRFQRRATRDQLQRNRTMASIEQQFKTTVNPMHNKFVGPSAIFADLVLSGLALHSANIKRVCELMTLGEC